ncbi:hypothetical protein [Azospirillum argentinense]|uniref:hypothetical protein n=1 Tax=Azospirillum argentinense TaxID=2970906 RepID=UPI0032DF689E
MTAPYLLPPTTSVAYPSNLPSGTVKLYADQNWSSDNLTITTSGAIEGVQSSFAGTNLNDRTTWVAFNLPEGVVLTLLEHKTTPPAGQPYSFNGCGRCVDLIGNGQTQTVDVEKLGANDCLSAYIWRTVDLNTGVFQLFDGLNYADNRNTFFLCEWPMATVLSLAGWFICDRAASIYFGGLTAQQVALYDGGQGDGETMSVAGWLSMDGIPDLRSYSFVDKEASWRWDLLPPVHSEVDPFTITSPVPTSPSNTISSSISGTNQGTATITDTVSVTSGKSQSLTLSVTDSYTIGYVQEVRFTYGIGLTGEVEVGCTFSMSYTYTGTKETSVTNYYDLSVSQTVEIPADCRYSSTMTILMAEIPPTSYSTPAVFYYTQPVPGSTYDAAMTAELGKTVYALRQTVTGYVNGGVSVDVRSSTETQPLSVAALADA